MKARKVKYERLVNTGNYSNEKYGIEVILEKGEKVEEAIKKAKRLVNRQLSVPSDVDRKVAEMVEDYDNEDIPF